MSELRERFKKERSRIDQHDLSKGHKARFLEKLARQEERKVFPLWKVAAASIAILLSGLVYWFYPSGSAIDRQEAEQIDQNADDALPIDDASFYYEQAIDQQFTTIEEFYGDEDGKALIDQTKLLIKELQEEYRSLEAELAKSGDEKIVIAMIENYQQRIELLEELIQKLNYIKQIKSESNEKSKQNA